MKTQRGASKQGVTLSRSEKGSFLLKKKRKIKKRKKDENGIFSAMKNSVTSEKRELRCSTRFTGTQKNATIDVFSEKLPVFPEIPSAQFSFHHLGGINKHTYNPVRTFVNKYMYIIYMEKMRFVHFLLTRNTFTFIAVLLLVSKPHISHFHNLTYWGVKFLLTTVLATHQAIFQ